MLQHLLPLLSIETEYNGTAIRVVLTDGTTVIATRDDLEAELLKTKPGSDLAGVLKLDVHRFGRKTTVAHLQHIPTGQCWLGVSFCKNPEKFSKSMGRDQAVREAALQFLEIETFHRKCQDHALQTQQLTS